MIPSILARHVEQGVKDFLRTTFPVTTPFFSGILESFLSEPETLFKGPYLDIQLPFQPGRKNTDFFPDLPMPFPPIVIRKTHSSDCPDPLRNRPSSPREPGSGKTECFLYPILDYCYRHRGEPGIKAILIYPMNALATDQAGRLAKRIHDSRLKDHVTAGIYVGQQEKNPSRHMTADRLISDKSTLRLAPPDILLTNYKMLDYLLIRPQDRPLWEQNKPDSLRFLVVDELHTFDGAQGSDLACLIRRLKARVGVEPGYLCGVGTSATLGDAENRDDLIGFASAVFGDPFTGNAIVSETRKSAGEFLENSLISSVEIVGPERVDDLDPVRYNDHRDYVTAQYRLWLGEEPGGDPEQPEWRIRLGEKIREHLFFYNLITILKGKIRSCDEVLSRLQKSIRELKEALTAIGLSCSTACSP